MALSMIRALALTLALVPSLHAKTVTHDFNVTWVTANPDGLADRQVVGINNKWPLPVIEVDKGDRLIVHVHNGLGDRDTSIHWHGMFQNTTNYMDGASMVTQCPVPPGSSMTYDFTVDQNGTYWYHAHVPYSYPDGYRQALIVHDKDAPFKFDEELTLTVTDWYHDLQDTLESQFVSVFNPSGAEPIPSAFLLNDTLRSSIPVKPNTTYLLRLINIGAFVGQYFYIEDHDFKIVEIDGVYTEPTTADTLYIAVAQRYAVLLTTKNETDKNFAIVTVADSTLLDTITPDLLLNNTNWLEYDKNADHPEANITVDVSSDLNPYDDATLKPYDQVALLPDPDLEIEVTVVMANLDNGYSYAFLNNITYTMPKVPSLLTALSAGDLSNNSQIYGEFTNPFVLPHNAVVQIVLNNNDTGSHPFHLHGHNFQVIERAPAYGPTFYDFQDGDPVNFDPSNHTEFSKFPARRDTVVLPPQGYLVLRFVADNPGAWLFHCHIDWHMDTGLAMVLIEAPDQMKERIKVPQDHLDVCAAAKVSSTGNAAGNSQNFLDLSGQPAQPGEIPAGFTARGIVALVFSVLAAVCGIISITIYGLAEVKVKHHDEVASTERASEGGASGEGGVVEQTVEGREKS